MINMENGKPEFLKILDCTSYHERSWKSILNTIIGLGYKPMSCNKCPHVKDCSHYKNMICTVNSGYCGIRPLEIKKYCTVEEAEKNLKENFAQTVESQNQGIKILKAQTGLGKTHTCLNYIKISSDKFLLVVPTHRLIRKIMENAQNMGVNSALCLN